MPNIKKTTKEAYITIMTVIAVSAISIAVVISLIDSGISSTKNSSDMLSLAKAGKYAEACVEESLQRIRDDLNYSGNLNLSFSDGTCQASVNKISESNFNIQAMASSSTATRKILVEINQVSPKINISSWVDPANF